MQVYSLINFTVLLLSCACQAHDKWAFVIYFPQLHLFWGLVMQIPASRIQCCGCNIQIHMTTEILWRKRDGMATL